MLRAAATQLRVRTRSAQMMRALVKSIKHYNRFLGSLLPAAALTVAKLQSVASTVAALHNYMWHNASFNWNYNELLPNFAKTALPDFAAWQAALPNFSIILN